MRSKREAVRFHIWSYAHFPLYLGIVVAGAGVERIVTAASKHALSGIESLILAGAVATVMAAMTAIDRTSAGYRRHAASGVILRSMVLAAATLGIGISGRFTVPVVLIATLASLCALQLVLSLRARAFAVATAVAVVGSALLPASALAEPEKKFAVGVVVTCDAPTGAVNAGTKFGPLFRIRSGDSNRRRAPFH